MNGSPGTAVSGTMPFKGARLTRFRSSAPTTVCSIVSFSSPSWRPGKTSIAMRPSVRSLTRSAKCWTASTVG
jgi:hypothetical protein